MIRKKSQISIFIIIMIVLIFLFIFLFSFQNNAEEIKNDDSSNLAGQQNYNFENLQVEIDFCLDNALEKSVILASSRGGLIFDEGSVNQKYVESVYFEEYKQDVLDIFNIKSEGVLQYSKIGGRGYINLRESDTQFQGVVQVPGYKNQFQQYILNEIFNCVNFEDYVTSGFSVEREIISTTVKQKISNTLLELNPIEGDNDDTLFLEVGDKLYEGKLRVENNKFLGDFSSSEINFLNGINLNDYKVINKDLSVYLHITFENEAIISTFYFPIVFSERNTVISSLSSTSTLQTRFKKLIQTVDTLIEKKINGGRDLDYSLESDLNSAISGSIDSISVSKTVLENRAEYKKFIYTINDKKSQFLGVPTKFHFAYENHAPWIRFDSAMTPCYRIQENTCMILFTPGFETSFSLEDLVDPIEEIDGAHVIFDEENYIGSTNTFKITSDGEVSFNALQGGMYNHNIKVQDGEAYTEYTLRFISGTIENVQNRDASSCFIIKRDMDILDPSFYPINSDFLGPSNYIKIFNGKNNINDHLPFFYSLQQENRPVYNPLDEFLSIELSETCVEDPSEYSIKWSGLPWENNQDKLTSYLDEIEIKFKDSNSNYISTPYTISAQIIDNTNSNVGEPLNIRVYPTSCLGPDEDSNGYSCCDTSILYTHKNIIDVDTRESFPLATTLEDTSFSIPMFFGLLLNDKSIDFGVDQEIDISEIQIWDTFGEDIASLYTADVGVTCSIYPRWEHNIVSINGGGPSKGEVIEIDSFNSIADNIGYGDNKLPAFDLNLGLEEIASNTCEFGIVEKKSLLIKYQKDGNNFQLVGGLSHSGISPIPTTIDYDNVFVLCDSSWRGYSGFNSLDEYDSYESITEYGDINSYRSKGFCSQGASTCLVANPHINSSTWDNPGLNFIGGGVCTKTRFNGNNLDFLLEAADKSSGISIDGDVTCIDDNNGNIVGTIDVLKEQTCGDSDPKTTHYRCTSIFLNSSQTCPISSSIDPSFSNSNICF